MKVMDPQAVKQIRVEPAEKEIACSDVGFYSEDGSQKLEASETRSSVDLLDAAEDDERESEDSSSSDVQWPSDASLRDHVYDDIATNDAEGNAEEKSTINGVYMSWYTAGWIEKQPVPEHPFGIQQHTSKQFQGEAQELLKSKIHTQILENGIVDLSLLSNSELSCALEAIGESPEVTKLICKNARLNDHSAAAIMDTLCLVPGKTELLDISGNPDLGPTAATAIARLLKTKGISKIKATGCGLEKYHDEIILPALRTMPEQFGATIQYATTAVKFTVGQRGQKVEISPGGASLFFPPNSVERPTEMSIQFKNPIGAFSRGVFPVTPILRCSPSGMVFPAPITIKLNTWVQPSDPDTPIRLKTTVRRHGNSKWVTHGSAKFTGENSVEFTLKHFSDVAVVANSSDADRVTASYCNLLFVPRTEPPIGAIQQVVSWYMPDQPCLKQDTIRRQEPRANLQSDFPFQLAPGGEVADALVPADDNVEPVCIRPAHITSIAMGDRRRVRYQVMLQNEGGNADVRTAFLKHSIRRNGGDMTDDEVILRWRRRDQVQPERVVHNHHYHTTVTNNQYIIEDSQIQQFITEEQVTETHLLQATVDPPLQEEDDQDLDSPVTATVGAAAGAKLPGHE